MVETTRRGRCDRDSIGALSPGEVERQHEIGVVLLGGELHDPHAHTHELIDQVTRQGIEIPDQHVRTNAGLAADRSSAVDRYHEVSRGCELFDEVSRAWRGRRTYQQRVHDAMLAERVAAGTALSSTGSITRVAAAHMMSEGTM